MTKARIETLCVGVVAVWTLLFAGEAHGWGWMGHDAVADVAQHYLTPRALSRALELLDASDPSSCDDTPDHGRPFTRLREAANWADCVNRHGGIPSYHWTKPLHFAFFPGTRDSCTSPAFQFPIAPFGEINGTSFAKRCDGGSVEGESGCDLVEMVAHLGWLLRDNGVDPDIRPGDVLKFLIHFVGDLHQPLHVDFPYPLGPNGTNTRGGNFIHVLFDNGVACRTSLHKMWDFEMIHSTIGVRNHLPACHTNRSEENEMWRYETFLETVYDTLGDPREDGGGEAAEEAREWLRQGSSPNPASWAVDAVSAACTNAFGAGAVVSDMTLGAEYVARNMPVIRRMIRMGGTRLAGLLNMLLDPEEPPASPTVSAPPAPGGDDWYLSNVFIVVAAIFTCAGLAIVVLVFVRARRAPHGGMRPLADYDASHVEAGSHGRG